MRENPDALGLSKSRMWPRPYDGTFFLVEWAEYWKLETALTRSLAADVIQIIKVTFEQGIREGDGRCKR